VVSSKIQRTVEKRQEIEYGGHQGRSACMGDSGGPAFIKRNGKLILAGITARGSSECDEEGVETDVRYFHGWIRKAQEALELVAR